MMMILILIGRMREVTGIMISRITVMIAMLTIVLAVVTVTIMLGVVSHGVRSPFVSNFFVKL